MSENKNKTIIIIIAAVITALLLCSSSVSMYLYFKKQSPKQEQEVKPEVKSEVKPEVKPEIIQEVKPEVKQEIKPEITPQIKSEMEFELIPTMETTQGNLSTVINSLKGNYCLDIQNQSMDDNINAIMHDCTGNTNELFTYMPTTKQIIASHSKKCLSFDPSNMKGKNVVQKTCLIPSASNISSQQFDLIGNTIKPTINNKLCLDVKKSGKTNGTNVQLYDCNGTDAQKWFYNFTLPTGATTHPTTQYAETEQINKKPIKNKLRDNYCLEVSNGAYVMNDCNNDPSQNFYFNSNKQFVNNDGSCMTFNIDKPQGNQLIASPCSGPDASNLIGQQFMQDNNAIKSLSNPKFCIDVKGSNKKNGAIVQMYGCNNTNAQKWTF